MRDDDIDPQDAMGGDPLWPTHHPARNRAPKALMIKDLRDAITVLLRQYVGAIRGSVCFERFEQAQQTESIARTMTATTAVSARYVSTNAECGLTAEQIDHARDIWRLALKLRVLGSEERDAAKAR